MGTPTKDHMTEARKAFRLDEPDTDSKDKLELPIGVSIETLVNRVEEHFNGRLLNTELVVTATWADTIIVEPLPTKTSHLTHAYMEPIEDSKEPRTFYFPQYLTVQDIIDAIKLIGETPDQYLIQVDCEKDIILSPKN